MTATHNYKITLAYDGTDFSGWQVQPNGTTIQDLLQKAASTITHHSLYIVGSGRTDAGVHALAQVAHLHCPIPLDPWKFRAAMNGILPPAIRISLVEEVPLSFHARYSATSKVYHYHIYTREVASPFKKRYCLHLWHRFHPELLTEAATLFVGEHDFTSFSNEAHKGACARNPVRNLSRLDCVPVEDGIRLEFESNGFLYKMVRNITGCLLEVATARRPLHEINEIFAAKDRRRAGRAAPAHPLFLVKVNYM